MISFVSVNGVANSHYEYDLNSNRVKSILGSTTKLATFDAQDRLKDFASNQYLFNLRGQLLERTDSSTLAKTKYTYNAFGDLKSVELPNQTRIDYLINGLHQRAGRMLNGQVDQYYGYDPSGRLMFEHISGGQVVGMYLYLTQAHSPDALIRGNTEYRMIKDHLGSIRLVINASTGIVAQELDYDEWGQVIKDTNPGFQLFGFAGGVYDKDTKLVRFGARDYDAETGRWTARDPLLFGGGDVNLYGYVGNDPVNWIDPINNTEHRMESSMGKISKKIVGIGLVAVLGVGLYVVRFLSQEKGNLKITGQTEVLKNAYPMNYPSTNPQPNEVIKTLSAGERVKYLDVHYGKDYAVYEIQIDGQKGYVASGGQFELQQE